MSGEINQWQSLTSVLFQVLPVFSARRDQIETTLG
jgi:hypothetical protein